MSDSGSKNGNLADIRVVEWCDEQGEYCGRLLSGLGADVIKIESPEGSPTRRIGPFLHDEPDPEGSLFFWNYNLGKRSVVLDLEASGGRERLLEILATADVFLESTPPGTLEALGLDAESLRARFPQLVVARISAFGDTGPWADYHGSDLVHLALGGPVMNCGYDPRPDGSYDLPPIAPQNWHAYHITGEQMAIGLLGALMHRRETGEGQVLSCAVHDAVSKCTELDLMSWVMRAAPFRRQTCRHAGERVSALPMMGNTKDGRWVLILPPMGSTGWGNLVEFLARYGMEADLAERIGGMGAAGAPGSGPGLDPELMNHITEVTLRLIRKFTYAEVPWQEAQEMGLMWVPLRKPHENALDEHWQVRGSVGEVDHPELSRPFTYALSKWVSDEAPWRTGPKSPRLGEHTDEILESAVPRPLLAVPAKPATSSDARQSRRGKSFALHDVRILDFTWYLASGGAPRFLAGMGADVVKVEWHQNPDLRKNMGQAPIGGAEARRGATQPLPPDNSTPNRSGQFMNIRSGQRGISLNVRHPKGLELAKRMVETADIVAEGFSPGVMDKWGLGYDVMRSIKPDIIYVQQSGFGSRGLYGKYRTLGPVAQALASTSEMSGLPEPAAPAGWGYSYLDWFGAYTLALAMLAALHHRARTGEGQWIDSSQCDAGIFLSGAAILDWSANGRSYARTGNRSPYKPAAPHGVYPCAGEDRWVAIACFDDTQWQTLVATTGRDEWARDPRFASLEARLLHQDALDECISTYTRDRDRYEIMHALQAVGIPAGVCQDARDRCEGDPQLSALDWMTELTGTEIGTWPIPELPVKMSATPPFIGGPIDRGAPAYGEDNVEVYAELLDLSADEVVALSDEGVI
ncbi:CoA transferase [Myxococcota bacterium]|nr:CoA transferase [Myxococcota bacterium]